MKKQKQSNDVLIIILVALAMLFIIFSTIQITKTYVKQNNIVTPRHSGVYIPINGDNFAVVVLDMNNTYEKQLVSANQQAFSEINKLGR